MNFTGRDTPSPTQYIVADDLFPVHFGIGERAIVTVLKTITLSPRVSQNNGSHLKRDGSRGVTTQHND